MRQTVIGFPPEKKYPRTRFFIRGLVTIAFLALIYAHKLSWERGNEYRLTAFRLIEEHYGDLNKLYDTKAALRMERAKHRDVAIPVGFSRIKQARFSSKYGDSLYPVTFNQDTNTLPGKYTITGRLCITQKKP